MGRHRNHKDPSEAAKNEAFVTRSRLAENDVAGTVSGRNQRQKGHIPNKPPIG